MLWVVVVSAVYSMYGYFRRFFTGAVGRRAPKAEAVTATVTTAQYRK